jgi:hypothetical protein
MADVGLCQATIVNLRWFRSAGHLCRQPICAESFNNAQHVGLDADLASAEITGPVEPCCKLTLL